MCVTRVGHDRPSTLHIRVSPPLPRVRREPAPALEAGPVATGDRCRAAATGVYYFLYSYLLLFILHDLLSCFLVWTPVVDDCWGGRLGLPFPSFPSLTNPRWSCLAVRDTPWFLDLQIPDLGLGPRVVPLGLGMLRGFGYARIASTGCGKMLGHTCNAVWRGFRHAS